jgi:hypothetical protein
MRFSIAAVLISVAFAGDTSNTAHCVFYREHVWGNKVHASIRIDDAAPVHKLPQGRYWETDVIPGRHVIYSDAPHNGQVVNVEAGHTYFFRMEQDYGPTIFQTWFKVLPTEPDIATLELRQLKPDK